MSSPVRISKANIDHMTKSLERLSIYDGHGKVHILQISPKADYMRILGNLDLDTIHEKIQELKSVEDHASCNGDLEEAERATNQINELREKEILLCNLGCMFYLRRYSLCLIFIRFINWKIKKNRLSLDRSEKMLNLVLSFLKN